MLDRYWAKVDRSLGPAACWPWLGYCERYGIFWGGEHRPDGAPIMVKAHRWTYEQFVGPIPAGMSVCHTCDNPPCCNPAHLFVGTHSDNMRDMVAKGRGVSRIPPIARIHNGEANGSARLTDNDVRSIRRRYADGGVSQQSLAVEYGVQQTAISCVVRHKTWQHVE